LNENEKLLDFLFSHYLMRMFDYIRLSLTADDSSALIAGSKLRVSPLRSQQEREWRRRWSEGTGHGWTQWTDGRGNRAVFTNEYA